MKRAFLLLLLFSFSFAQFGGIPGEGIPVAPNVDIPSTAIGGMPISPYIRVPAEPCEECPTEAELAFLFSSLDEEAEKVSSSMAVEREGRRVAVDGATLFFQMFDETGTLSGTCRAHTDSNGTAEFLYEEYDCSKGCSVKILFCCSNPVTQGCALPPCLGTEIDDFSMIPICNGYEGAWPSNSTVEGVDAVLSPMVDTVNIPPEETSATALAFTLCLPLLAIFGFLGAAMFASGRDPFAMFSFYTPRYTRGAERPIGARGVTISGVSLANLLTQAILKPAIKAGVKSAKEAAAAEAAGTEQPSGRVTTVQTAAGEGAVPGGRRTPAEAAAPRVAAAPEAPGGGRGGAPEMDTRAAALTGTVGQRFLVALFSGRLGEFFAQFRGSLRVSQADLGMGTGEFFARLGSTLVMYMMPVWWVGELTSGAIQEALQKGVAGERNAQYCTSVIPALDQGTTVVRDADGRVVGYRISFRNPATGEIVNLNLNRAEGEIFLNANKHMPQQIAQVYQMNMQVEANRAAISAVADDFGRSCGTMGEQALREHEGAASEEVRGAIGILLDQGKSADDRLNAFVRIVQAEGANSEVAVLAAAALGAGRTYAELSDLAGGSREFRAVLRGMRIEDFSAQATGDVGGNLVVALSLARGTFAGILGTREGAAREADALGLETLVSHLSAEVGQSVEAGGLQYRDGTNNFMANLAIAGGLAQAASASEVAGISTEERADVQGMYRAIITEREEQLGRPMTARELRDFEPLTAEGREVFARHEAIESYDAMCRQVTSTVDWIRDAARDPSLTQPTPTGVAADPSHIGFNSNYDAIISQAMGSGIADSTGNPVSIENVPDEMRDRASAYAALSMLGADSTALASQATVTEMEGRVLGAIAQAAERYDFMCMDAVQMAQRMSEDTRQGIASDNAQIQETRAEITEALGVFGRADASEAERERAAQAVGESYGQTLETMGMRPEEARLFSGMMTQQLLATEAGSEEAKAQLDDLNRSLDQHFASDGYTQQINEASFLAASWSLIGAESYTSTDANQWLERRAAYEGRFNEDGTPNVTEQERELASTNAPAVRDEAIGYIEAYARGRGQDAEREAAPYIESLRGMMEENQAMQLANAQAQERIRTEEDVMAAGDMAAGVEQGIARDYQQTQLGALIPREEPHAPRARGHREDRPLEGREGEL